MTAEVLSPTAVVVGATAADQAEAIERVGSMLVAEGFVTPDYVTAMRAREAIISTYLGNGIALPHGTSEAQGTILRTGLAVAQFPAGVPWGDEPARLVIGLAAKSEEHIAILARLAGILDDAALCERLGRTDDPLEIHRALTAEGAVAPTAPLEPAAGDVVIAARLGAPLHARPAAEIVEQAGDFEADVVLLAGGRRAAALSVTQLIGLGATTGDEVTVSATGDDAADAVAAIVAILTAEEH